MLYSMTGFGKGEVNHSSGKFDVEIHSLNRKHFELSVYMPKSFMAIEPEIRKMVSKSISRGKVSLQINFEPNHRQQGQVVVNKDLAKKYHRTLKQLQRELGLKGQISIDHLVQNQDLVKFIPHRVSLKEAEPLIFKGVDRALSSLLRMRSVEGKALFREITKRLKLVRSALNRIEKKVPKTVEAYERKLFKKIKEADSSAKKNEELIMKEIALFADRIDVTEELSRLESHLSQFNQSLRKREPVGRSLDFIIQEMHREVNTIGSKANSAAVSKDVVFLKSEIEKIREQVQNVE